MGFFRNIRKSVYDRDFYANAKTESFGPAFKQYTLLVLCIAILISIPIYVSVGFGASYIKKAGDIRTKVLAIYPDELALTFQNGQMTSNVEEPYSIPMPKEFGVKGPKNLVVINTRRSITLADFERYDTSAILGNDAVWIYDAQKDKIEIQRFDKFDKGFFVLNKEKATQWVDLALKIAKPLIVGLLILLPFLIFALFWIGYLAYLLFGALVIWLIAKLRKVNLTYGQSYKLGLYLLTLPILYGILTTGPLSMFRIPFGFTLILAVIAYINFGPAEPTKELSLKSEPGLPMNTNSTLEAKTEEKNK